MITAPEIAKGIALFVFHLTMCLGYIVCGYVAVVCLGALSGWWELDLPPDTILVNFLFMVGLIGVAVDFLQWTGLRAFQYGYRVYQGIVAFFRGPDHG